MSANLFTLMSFHSHRDDLGLIPVRILPASRVCSIGLHVVAPEMSCAWVVARYGERRGVAHTLLIRPCRTGRREDDICMRFTHQAHPAWAPSHACFKGAPSLPDSPMSHSVTRSVLFPRPAVLAVLLRTPCALRVSAFRKSSRQTSAQNADRKDFPNLPKKHVCGTWERGTLTSLRAGVSRVRTGQIQTGETPMALYTNTATVKGFLGKDAETFATRSQKTFVVLSIATKSGYKDQKSKQWVNHTEWHRIVAFGKPADYAKGLKKGDYVEVEGELHSTEYEKEVGQGKNKVKVTFRDKEIRAGLVKKLEAPAKGENLDAEPITEDDAA